MLGLEGIGWVGSNWVELQYSCCFVGCFLWFIIKNPIYLYSVLWGAGGKLEDLVLQEGCTRRWRLRLQSSREEAVRQTTHTCTRTHLIHQPRLLVCPRKHFVQI